jgi:hypothetical protein
VEHPGGENEDAPAASGIPCVTDMGIVSFCRPSVLWTTITAGSQGGVGNEVARQSLVPSMIANLKISPVNFATGVGINGLRWWGGCKAEFVDYNRDSYPLRGDVKFLNRLTTELHLDRREDGKLNDLCMCHGIDESVSYGKEEGYYPDHYDLLLMRHYEAPAASGPFLGLHVLFSERKFGHFSDLMLRVTCQSNMTINIACDFNGFREEHFDVAGRPTKEEFLAGAPYLASGDFSTAFKPAVDPPMS